MSNMKKACSLLFKSNVRSSAKPVNALQSYNVPRESSNSQLFFAANLLCLAGFATVSCCDSKPLENRENAIQINDLPKDELSNILYPPLQPYTTGKLKVSNVHELYYEECGNPNGKPVVLLHGGPGAGCSEKMRQFHDPKKYRIILFDQRGAGKSTPHASLVENTTWHLVQDIEMLREHLGIKKWQVFGGSWGSTLSIAYAEKHPHRVSELVLRGIFHLRKEEIHFYYQNGASFIYPEQWEKYKNAIPEDEQHDFVAAYHNRLTSKDPAVRLPAAIAWTTWETTTSNLIPPAIKTSDEKYSKFAEAFARIENHYFTNGGFFETNEYLLENAHKLHGIPTVIVQGRYDVVCPMKTAWEFHAVVPQAQLRVVQTAGHSAFEVGIAAELVAATDQFAN